MNIKFSVAKKDKGYLTKILSLNKKTGKIIKDSSQCRMSSGTLTTYEIDSFQRFKRALMLLSKQHNKALVHGIPKNSYPKQTLKLVSKAKYTGKEENTITRTKENICYPDGAGVLLFDHDAARADSIVMKEEAAKSYKPEQLIEILAKIHPNIASAAYVSNPSTSSCIYNKEGKELRGEGAGAHIYLFPEQATDIPRYLETLGKRLILAGYGRIEVSRSGALNVRTLIDLTVGSPERLDFVGGAVCRDGLVQKKPEPTLKEGSLLNTLSLPELTEAETETYSDAIASLKQQASGYQAEIKGVYITTEAKKLIQKQPKLTFEKSKAIIESRQNHLLQDNDLLYFARNKGKPITVLECISNADKYDKQGLSDPLEPEYDGGSLTKAIFYLNKRSGNSPCVNSFAHGQVKYLFQSLEIDEGIKNVDLPTGGTGQIKKDKKDKKAKGKKKKQKKEEGLYPPPTLVKLNEMNNKYSACIIGNQFRIIKEGFDEINNKHTLDLLATSAFMNFFSNIKCAINTENGQKLCQISKLWMEWEERKTYSSVIFHPGNNIPKGAYNLFRGFPVKPRKGKWPLFRQHIEEIICAGDLNHAHYLLDWMARCVRDPGGDRPGVAVVMKGGKGCGKGVFANYFGKIFGEAFMPISTSKGFTGNFNAHLSKCLCVFLDEAVWSGDKQSEGQLKALITEPYMLFEPKGIDSVSLKNFINVIIASNENWVCPATIDERRFFVLEPTSEMAGNTEYFNRLCVERDAGGVEALYYDLLNREYDLDALRLAPKTIGLEKQVEQSLDSVTEFWKTLLDRGFLLSDASDGSPKPSKVGQTDEFWPDQAYKYEIYHEFSEIFCKKKRFFASNSVFWRQTWSVFGGKRGLEKQKHIGLRVFISKNLFDLRRLFEKNTGLKIKNEGENEDFFTYETEEKAVGKEEKMIEKKEEKIPF